MAQVLVTGHRPLIGDEAMGLLQQSAASGELVVAADVHDDLDALLPNPDRRAIQLRGGQAPTSALVDGAR